MELHRERGSSWNYIAEGNHHGKASLWKKKINVGFYYRRGFIAELHCGRGSSWNFVVRKNQRGISLRKRIIAELRCERESSWNFVVRKNNCRTPLQ